MSASDMDVDVDIDVEKFVSSAQEFASKPGFISDTEVVNFLTKYPLPAIFRTLQQNGDVAELEPAAVGALHKIFSSNYGSSLLPSTLPYAHLGLQAASPQLRRLACEQISKLLNDIDLGAKSLEESHLAGPLLQRLTDDDSEVAATAAQALEKLGKSPAGLRLLFTDAGCGQNGLRDLATKGSATVRIRALSLAANVSAQSPAAAEAVRKVSLMSRLVKELSSPDDILATVNGLELLTELANTPSGASFIAADQLLPQLRELIADPVTDALIRSRAMMVAARLLTPHATLPSPVSAQEAVLLVQALDRFLNAAASKEEVESAMDAIATIGLSARGTELLLAPPSPPARHVVETTFKILGGATGAQLAATHALASVAGVSRAESPILSSSAESTLKELIYQGTVKFATPGGAIWALLQQTQEVRLATYGLIMALAARPWGISEICSKPEIIAFLTDPHSETKSKEAMERRHAACVASATGAATAARQGMVFIPPEALNKLDAAARRGPYLAKELREAIPIVTTDERPPQPPPPPM